MKSLTFYSVAFLCALSISVPGISHAATVSGNLEISAWVPYWRTEAGVASTLAHFENFTEINPFLFTVKSTGELNEASPLTHTSWQQLKARSKAEGVRFIPTITWGGSDAIHDILSDPIKRADHIRSITRNVYAYDLDGIDIDYEAKFARTRPYFSLFLQGLEEAIGFDRFIMCTIESRTPLDSRYSSPESIPADIEYANDFAEINKYCDRVRIMAYDQGRIDLKLNKEKTNPYIPVADVDWVEKVMRLIAADIDPKKLVLGVPTYGYEYDTFLDESGRLQYSRLWSFNPGYADQTVAALNITPERNSAGELFLTYPATQAIDPIIPLPNATRIMSWSDAEAIRQKLALAQKLGLAGVAIFKVDGGEDQKLWNILPAFAKPRTGAAVPPPMITPPVVSPTPTPHITTRPTKNLYYGLRTEDVRALQRYLNANGFAVASTGGGSKGNETTFFGPATRAAVVRLQKAHGITPAAGYYGPVTRSVLTAKGL